MEHDGCIGCRYETYPENRNSAKDAYKMRLTSIFLRRYGIRSEVWTITNLWSFWLR